MVIFGPVLDASGSTGMGTVEMGKCLGGFVRPARRLGSAGSAVQNNTYCASR
jgi:hypothetical protein